MNTLTRFISGGKLPEISQKDVRKYQKKNQIEKQPFISLSRSNQKKIAKNARVIRQMQGDSISQRLHAYRQTINFHIDACSNDHVSISSFIKNKSQDPNAKDEDGRTALHFAARYGSDNTVYNLLTNDASIDDPDFEVKWTPLHYAAFGGHKKCAQILIENSPKPRLTMNRKDRNGMTPLMLACGQGHIDFVKYLLNHQADVDDTDNDGWTALHYAAFKDQATTAEILLQHGINFKIKTSSSNETASELADRLKKTKVAIMLYAVT